MILVWHLNTLLYIRRREARSYWFIIPWLSHSLSRTFLRQLGKSWKNSDEVKHNYYHCKNRIRLHEKRKEGGMQGVIFKFQHFFMDFLMFRLINIVAFVNLASSFSLFQSKDRSKTFIIFHGDTKKPEACSQPGDIF